MSYTGSIASNTWLLVTSFPTRANLGANTIYDGSDSNRQLNNSLFIFYWEEIPSIMEIKLKFENINLIIDKDNLFVR